jgi:hypothetical protein
VFGHRGRAWAPRSRFRWALEAFGRNVLLVAALGDYPTLGRLCAWRVGTGGGEGCVPRLRLRVRCGRLALLSSPWWWVLRLGGGRGRAQSLIVAGGRGGTALRPDAPRIWGASQARGCSPPREASETDKCLRWSAAGGRCRTAGSVPVVLNRAEGEGSISGGSAGCSGVAYVTSPVGEGGGTGPAGVSVANRGGRSSSLTSELLIAVIGVGW